ncbi:MAG: zinc-dependent metalloprotease family protein, partial [Gemmatimonadota bacterium]|nr:zinc-dependent metalloprotease family protein [Gemmatimonadota bacterium]
PSVSLPVADGYAVRARFQDASLESPGFDVVEAPDAVRLLNPSSGQTGIVVDGVNNIVRVQDSIHITTATTTAVGVLRSETPSHDVAVFAPDRRPELVQASWTPEADTVSITLRDPISLPVTVWVIAGAFADERAKMEAALGRVSEEWRRERMGLAIGDVEFMDATPQAPDFEIFALGLGAPFANLQNGVGRASGRFNIYVVAEIRESDGLSDGFAENFGTAIAVTSEAMGAGGALVVAHEMGHNFGLRHPGAVEGFINQANMMRPERNTFVLTEGQIFRAHFDRFTPLRSFRPGDQFPPRTCEAVDATTTCPALAFRVWSESDPAASRLGR